MRNLDCQKREEGWYNVVKTLFLAAALFCAVGVYTVALDVKRIVFAYIVGKEYLWVVRILATLILIPAVFLYSKLVNRIKRHHLLYVCSGLQVIFSLISAYCIAHPGIGIANTDASPDRLFGWFFYLGVEMYYPFVVSVLWAFANSINSPDKALNNYGWMMVGAKFGGLIVAVTIWLFLPVYSASVPSVASDSYFYAIIIGAGALLLCMVPLVIFIMMRMVPARYLHGYEVAYQLRTRERADSHDQSGFSGLAFIAQNYYAMGIFCIVFLHSLSMSVLSYRSIGVAQSGDRTASQALRYLIEVNLLSQGLGLILSIFCAGVLLKRFSVRQNLLLVPVVGAVAFIALLCFFDSPYVLLWAMVATRSIYFALNRPLLEMLYTPTDDNLKFKSRVWIDSFGPKCSRTIGSLFNMAVEGSAGGFFVMIHGALFSVITVAWFCVAFFLGNRFETATRANEVIGGGDES